jgi:hypothetical protein
VLGACVAALWLLAPAAALAGSETASAGGVEATLTWSDYPDEPSVRLDIARHGVPVHGDDVRSDICGGICLPAGEEGVVQVAQFSGDAEPEVVVRLTTGGAHCCTLAQVLAWDPVGGRYEVADEHNFLDAGFRLRRRGTKMDFQTADARFAYVFTAYAASAFPARVLTFTGRRFANVTRRHRGLVAASARRHWRDYVRRRGRRDQDVRGFFAAWAADMYTLGQGRRVQRELRKGVRRGWFGGDRQWRRGASYARYLNSFLRRTGYR